MPPYTDWRSDTLMACLAASLLTTNRPSCSLLARSNSGGFASRRLMSASSSWLSPRPRSSTSATRPVPARSALTSILVFGGEKTVAFSTSSATRWMTSLTAFPATRSRDSLSTSTRT